MDEVSVDGAIAAATYFLELYPYVYNTGDLAEWTAMSHPECQFCASVVENVTELAAEGGRHEGSETTISESTGTEIDPGRFFGVDVVATQSPSVTFDSQGNVTAETPDPVRYSLALNVIHEGSGWLIQAVQVIDESSP